MPIDTAAPRPRCAASESRGAPRDRARWPDAFVAGDVALQKALGVQVANNPRQAAQAAEAASQRWKPWRSYAVLRAWSALPKPTIKSPTRKAAS